MPVHQLRTNAYPHHPSAASAAMVFNTPHRSARNSRHANTAAAMAAASWIAARIPKKVAGPLLCTPMDEVWIVIPDPTKHMNSAASKQGGELGLGRRVRT